MELQPGTKKIKQGICMILISPPYGEMGWHMSISAPSRCPTWDEIKKAWYNNIPDAKNKWGAMFFPPVSDYVNVHPYCFHIHETSENAKNIFKLQD